VDMEPAQVSFSECGVLDSVTFYLFIPCRHT
jgi:hypothetical protein